MEPLQRGAALFPAAALRSDLGKAVCLLIFRVCLHSCGTTRDTGSLAVCTRALADRLLWPVVEAPGRWYTWGMLSHAAADAG